MIFDLSQSHYIKTIVKYNVKSGDKMEQFLKEDLYRNEKYLYKVKKPAKFAILYVDKETENYIIKNSQTKRVFKMSFMEFHKRFELIKDK